MTLRQNTKRQLPAKILTIEARRRLVVEAFVANGHKPFGTLINVEGVTPKILRRTTTERTILQVAVDTLNRAGFRTESTVGGVMGALNLDEHDINQLACYCHNGTTMTGSQALARLLGIMGPLA